MYIQIKNLLTKYFMPKTQMVNYIIADKDKHGIKILPV